MKKLMITIAVVVVVVLGNDSAGAQRTYRRNPGGYISRGHNRYDRDYNYRYRSYPDYDYGRSRGSLLSAFFGVPTYNDKEHWKYENRVLDIGEKELNIQHDDSPNSQSCVKDQQIQQNPNVIYGVQVGSQQYKQELEKSGSENQRLKIEIEKLKLELEKLKLQQELKKAKK